MEQLSSEFQALRLRLEGDGWDVQYITPHDPIQIEGYLPSEEPFFFQVEDGRASIMIYLLDGESTWTAEMRGEVAKWSLGREVERYLDTLTDLYYNGVQDKTKIVVTAR